MIAAISARRIATMCGCLFAVATLACDKGPAWVLWGATEAVCTVPGGCKEDWRMVEGYSSKRDCEREASKRRTMVVTAAFTCLPDTVDPREPKGTK